MDLISIGIQRSAAAAAQMVVVRANNDVLARVGGIRTGQDADDVAGRGGRASGTGVGCHLEALEPSPAGPSGLKAQGREGVGDVCGRTPFTRRSGVPTLESVVGQVAEMRGSPLSGPDDLGRRRTALSQRGLRGNQGSREENATGEK